VGDASEALAVIDIGSNSGRMVVVKRDQFGYLDVLESEGTALRLVHELASSETLGESVIERTLEALRGFQAIARGAGAQQAIAVATAAVREATNGEAFVQQLASETGLEIEIISGDTEACYGFMGAVYGVPVEDGVLIDIGGGSMQVGQFRRRELVRSWSLPLGALRLSDRFLLSDPATPAELRRLQDHVRKTLREADVPSIRAGQQIVGTGGTIRNLAKLSRMRRDYPIRRLHGYSLTRRELSDIVARLAEQTGAQRVQLAGLNASRFDSIVGGAACAHATVEMLGGPTLLVSGQGLREGVALGRFGGYLPAPQDVRRSAVRAVADRFASWDARLAAEREQAALAVLEALDPDAEAEQREALTHAAMLLDIGRSIDLYSRHDHTAMIILAADLWGFSHRALALLAATVRLAEKGTANLKNWSPLLRGGDHAALARIAAVLALADAITRQTPPDEVSPVHCHRAGSQLLIESPRLDPWPMQEALRRIQQVFAIQVAVRG